MWCVWELHICQSSYLHNPLASQHMGSSIILHLYFGHKIFHSTHETWLRQCVWFYLQEEFEFSVDQRSYLDAHQSCAIFIQLSKGLLSSLILLNGSTNPEEINICVCAHRLLLNVSNTTDFPLFIVECIKIQGSQYGANLDWSLSWQQALFRCCWNGLCPSHLFKNNVLFWTIIKTCSNCSVCWHSR